MNLQELDAKRTWLRDLIRQIKDARERYQSDAIVVLGLECNLEAAEAEMRRIEQRGRREGE